jgi:hypothetical protein
MKIKAFTLPMSFVSLLALAGCDRTDTGAGLTSENGKAGKPPLVFDASKLLYPPAFAKETAVAAKTAAGTYYTYTIGGGLTSADKERARATIGFNGTEVLFPSAKSVFTEATYSWRLSRDPEKNLWVPEPAGTWLRTGAMHDTAQTEIHYQWKSAYETALYQVDIEFEVGSEQYYDFFWINSTGNYPACNNPGVTRKMISGVASGKVSFTLSGGCPDLWVGIYYVKDFTVSQNGDFARIKNVKIFNMATTGR